MLESELTHSSITLKRSGYQVCLYSVDELVILKMQLKIIREMGHSKGI